MPEFKYARGRIADSIRFISTEMKEFQEDYARKTRKDYQIDRKLQKLMDRTVENILTALIEICGTYLTEQNIAAENYAEALRGCAQALGFKQSEQEKLASLAVLRNRLAHRYLNFRWEAIKSFKAQSSLIVKLMTTILEKEK
jgi:uncharacterized protein YutE (UPF0331/DUF86 family)